MGQSNLVRARALLMEHLSDSISMKPVKEATFIAQQFAPLAVAVAVQILLDEKESSRWRLEAAKFIKETGMGKAPQLSVQMHTLNSNEDTVTLAKAIAKEIKANGVSAFASVMETEDDTVDFIDAVKVEDAPALPENQEAVDRMFSSG